MNSKPSILRRSPRLPAYTLAALVVGLALSCSGRALAVANGPNALNTSYNLAGGATSAAITPAVNVPVQVTGVCITSTFQGVGQVVMLHTTGGGLTWSGINSPGIAGDSGTIVSGQSSVAGTFIVELDQTGSTVLEVNNADSFRVHNLTPANRSGSVTTFW